MAQPVDNAQPGRRRMRTPGKIDPGARSAYGFSWGNLHSWYDANYGYNLDTASRVIELKDKSGNGHTLISEIAADRPTWTAAQFGAASEYPGIVFALVRYLLGGSLPQTGNLNRSIIAVLKGVTDPGSGYAHIAHWGSNTNDDAWGLCARTSASGFKYGQHYWGSSSDSGIVPDANTKCIMVTKNGDAEQWYENGVTKNTNNKTCNTGHAASVYGLHLGTRIQVYSEGCVFNLAEILFYSSLINVTQAWADIKSKYGL